jgi:predicted DNA-binding antitoxin AbrB/MazE fold protein
MVLIVRAVYHDGQVQLLDPVDLPDGQQLKISIEPIAEPDAVRAALGDLVIWPDLSDDSDAWVEAEAEAVASALSRGRSLTEIIMEERDSGW